MKFIIYLLIFTLVSCGSGGGDTPAGDTAAKPEVDATPSVTPKVVTCSSEKELGHPFQGIGLDETGLEYYLICTAEQFIHMGDFEYLDKPFKIGAFIDFDSYYIYEDDKITNQFIIGTETQPFTGSLYGDGWGLDNFKYNDISSDYCGIFGVTNNAVISFVTFDGVDVSGSPASNCGGLAGKMTQSIVFAVGIENSVVSGHNVGGLVGQLNYSIIESSFTSAEVRGSGSAGGFAGINNGPSALKNSFSTSIIMGDSMGGIFGLNPILSEGLVLDSLIFNSDSTLMGCPASLDCGGVNIRGVSYSSDPLYFLSGDNLDNWESIGWLFFNTVDDYPGFD